MTDNGAQTIFHHSDGLLCKCLSDFYNKSKTGGILTNYLKNKQIIQNKSDQWVVQGQR